MVEGGVPASTSPPSSRSDRGAERASGRGIPERGPPPRRDDPLDGAVVRVRARGRADRGPGPDQGSGAWTSPREWRIQGGSLPPGGGWGVPVAESVLAPPGPIPNPVVTQRSAGEY